MLQGQLSELIWAWFENPAGADIDSINPVKGALVITPNAVYRRSNDPSEGPAEYEVLSSEGIDLDDYALKTVAGKYRIKDNGTFQLWNTTQSAWHTLTITGPVGAEALEIAAAEA